MARVTVEDCLEKVENRFALVIISAARTKQLLSGMPPLIKHKKNKAVVTSLREIAAGKIKVDKNVIKLKKDERATQ